MCDILTLFLHSNIFNMLGDIFPKRSYSLLQSSEIFFLLSFIFWGKKQLMKFLESEKTFKNENQILNCFLWVFVARGLLSILNNSSRFYWEFWEQKWEKSIFRKTFSIYFPSKLSDSDLFSWELYHKNPKISSEFFQKCVKIDKYQGSKNPNENFFKISKMKEKRYCNHENFLISSKEYLNFRISKEKPKIRIKKDMLSSCLKWSLQRVKKLNRQS